MEPAAMTARLSDSAVATSGESAPAGTATAMPDLAMSVILVAMSDPPRARSSMVLRANTTMSAASPPRTRFATSTPPAASMLTLCEDAFSNRAARSTSNSREAMEVSSLRALIGSFVYKQYNQLESASEDQSSNHGHPTVNP